jgi:hypothetical protein
VERNMNEKEKAFIESQQQYDLFYKTFGGTTFQHLINWLNLQVEQNKFHIYLKRDEFGDCHLRLRKFNLILSCSIVEIYCPVSDKFKTIFSFKEDSNLCFIESMPEEAKLLYQELKKYTY